MRAYRALITCLCPHTHALWTELLKLPLCATSTLELQVRRALAVCLCGHSYAWQIVLHTKLSARTCSALIIHACLHTHTLQVNGAVGVAGMSCFNSGAAAQVWAYTVPLARAQACEFVRLEHCFAHKSICAHKCSPIIRLCLCTHALQMEGAGGAADTSCFGSGAADKVCACCCMSRRL